MFTKRKFKVWLIIGGGGLGVLGLLLLFQCNGGKQSINTPAPSSTVQTSSNTPKRWINRPPPVINTPQQSAKPNPSPSENPENVLTTPDTSVQVSALDKEETIRSLVDSLSDADIKTLEKLTIRDILSDEELERLDHKLVESLEKFVELVPQIVELKAGIVEIMVYMNNISKQKNWSQDKEKYEKLVKANERKNEMLDELATLRSRASNLKSLLLDSDFDSIGPERNKEWIRSLGEQIWWGTKDTVPDLQSKPSER